MGIQKEKFGVTKEGKEVTKYILENKNGLKLVLSDLGADILSIIVPDRDGVFEDISLGFDNVADYETNKPAFGAVIGRFANRIAGAGFELNGKKYQLDDNDKSNCLHGGFTRFEHQMYEAECSSGEGSESVSFSRVSPDMEQGFPGELTLTVTYTLNDADEVMIEYHAVSDADTVINLTNHNYFNLGKGGHKCLDVRKQMMKIFADEYTPVNEILIPTGEFRPVEGTALDFREMHVIGDRIGKDAPDEKTVSGYDHNFVLRNQSGNIGRAATYQDTKTGRRMEVFTDFPGIQVYSAATLGTTQGKDGVTYGPFAGICFETQNYPNAVNQEGFPDAVLKAGEEYERTAIFRFSTFM